jgi:hypothetical protein
MSANNQIAANKIFSEFTGKPIFVETIPIIGEVPMGM